MSDTAREAKATGLTIFRAADARPEEGIGVMRSNPMPPAAVEGGRRMMAAGVEHGSENRLLFAGGGFSLAYAWFKSGYPLPRHTHDGDCLYYILAGSLRLGTQTLGKGDGFLLGGGVPYTYTPGDQGVELLEFRAADSFDISLLAANPAFWEKALGIVNAKVDIWRIEARPSEAGDAR